MKQLPSGSQANDRENGLSNEEAQQRLEQYGRNEIPEQRANVLFRLLSKFWGPIPWMLEIIVLFQVLLGKNVEAAIIAILLSVNAGISLIEEGRASKALELLRNRMIIQVRVLRDGAWRLIDSSNLVPGDVIHLRMGDLSPADVKILEGTILLDQSALTGESVPVEASIGDQAYSAAVVRRGEATGEVTATGLQTYFGKTAELVRTAQSRSHLAVAIFKIVRVLIIIDAALIISLLFYAFLAALPLIEVLPFALILLVASVPVALPATYTLSTALGAAELARSGVLLTRLSSIEEAAGMDVLCTDKTGTLTQNRLTLTEMQCVAAISDHELLRFAALASDPATQDPIDMAILNAASMHNILKDLPPRIEFIPFDPANRYSLGRYQQSDEELCVVKGAHQAVSTLIGSVPSIEDKITQLEASGERVISVAFGNSRTNLHLAGLIALEDPPRPDSAELINGLKQLGIKVVMVTGDDAITAGVISKQVGIDGLVAPVGTINHIEGEQALDYGVYARVFPEDKIRLIRLLQKSDHVVGMTGDGVNDAPALKQADIGIAVTNATDVARAAANIALTTPGLVDVLTAVKISRRIYQRMLTYTINKIMKTLEIAVFLTIGVIVTHTFIITPLLIVLLLFTNDFVTMSLATDHVSFSQHPDRWDVRTLMLIGSILAAFVLILSFSMFFVGRDVLGLRLSELQTLVFVMLVATGQGNVYLVRERGPLWRSRPSQWLLISSLIDLAVVSVLATTGVLMAPVSPLILIFLLIIVAVYLLMLDQMKVKIFHSLFIK